MLENQLAPGLMLLKTSLSQSISTRPEGNTWSAIIKIMVLNKIDTFKKQLDLKNDN